MTKQYKAQYIETWVKVYTITCEAENVMEAVDKLEEMRLEGFEHNIGQPVFEREYLEEDFIQNTEEC